MTTGQSRREFVRTAGVGLLGFYIGGCREEMTPAAARARSVPFSVLDAEEVATLEALGETLLPGSAAAGLAHFVDHQLSAPPGKQLLMLKYLGVNPPFTPFYRHGLAALDTLAEAVHGLSFQALDAAARDGLTAQIAQGQPEGWDGPPAPLFYFVVRSDALDVVYGTVDGIESLGWPYMAHILPPSKWGE